MTTDLTEYKPKNQLSAFSNTASFELAQRQAKALAESDLVPQQYRGKLANCLVALEIAQRCESSPLMVMQNLNIIHGKPSWSSTYIIAAINSCGRFEPLRFKMEGSGDTRKCIAWTKDRSGETLEGPEVSISMAKAEGWYQKTGSKWQTMPDLMLRYRAASFFGRLYASEILMGMRSDDEEREIIDVTNQTHQSTEAQTSTSHSAAENLNKKIRDRKTKTIEAEAKPITPETSETRLEPQPEEHF